MKKYLEGVEEEYCMYQTNLIRNINDYLPFWILSPFEKICKSKGKLFYNSCKFANQVTKYETTERESNCNLRFLISYAKT